MNTHTETSIFDIAVTDIQGHETNLSAWQGQVLLVVNVASKCGFTPQYAGLESLYQRFKGRGFAVLGFPCNQFGSQEPGNESEIQNFCSVNYKVTFPMFAKVDVNGPDAHPLFQVLKKSSPGILGTEGIKWNFTKFLINREGHVVNRYGSATTPESIASDIEALL